MGIPTSILVLFALLFLAELEFCSTRSNLSCIESERQALVKFKESLTDASNRLSSWVGEDCCTWNGVGCSNKTGHVLKLDLRNPTLFDFDIYTSANDPNVMAKYIKTCLGGEINHSLINLKHLRYLDLSMNHFLGIRIPEFLGSLGSLRYLNLSTARFGGWVPHHLGNLSSLMYLDLGSRRVDYYNTFIVDSLRWASALSSLKYLNLDKVILREATDWLDAINMLPSLSELSLAHCELGSIPPLSHVNITSLSSLDLQWNNIDSIPLWLSNVSRLVNLRVNYNHFQGSVPDTIGKLTSLTILDLSRNKFNTSMPIWLCGLSNLVSLDLSSNSFQGSIPDCIGNLTSLSILNLNYNSFRGRITTELGNLTQLAVLDLSHNEIGGKIPHTMSNFCSLRVLYLYDNSFCGEVPFLVENTSACFHNSLKELELDSNNFTGNLPSKLEDIRNLEILSLSNNSFSGPIPESIGRLSLLRSLDIHDNQLNGRIPSSLGQLSKLETIDVSNNALDGPVSELHFASLTRLYKLSMSSNSLVLNVSSNWVPPFQLQWIDMSSCKLGPKFPHWLQTQRHVELLFMSNANISDTIPDWFEDVFYDAHDLDLDLSYNQISGKLPQFPSDAYKFDLSNNLLSGNIPQIDDNTTLGLSNLLLSNNALTGAIPEYLCKTHYLFVIDLSRNQLSGGIPSCLGNLQVLRVLDLRNNNLEGNIPSSLGSLQGLESLHLHNNRFHGKLPSSLQKLTGLMVLDLGKNELADIIPHWIGEKLSNLKFLNLKSNKFNGGIPIELCHLSALQLLDLAQNYITGHIPHCFGNFTAMIVNDLNDDWLFIEYAEHEENILDSMKGRELEYTETVLPYLTSIDLSNNYIVGEIPEELMDLSGLLNLNLAGNHLKGRIPEKIGNLEQLETLDLSRNKLSGSIPPSLSALHYLSRLNLSFNNLSGQIPKGNQLQTLTDQSIYMGNDGLCGLPLLKSCPGDESDDHKDVGENKNGEKSEFLLFFYAGIAPGFLVGFLGVCGILHFQKSWRYAFFQLVDNIYNRLVVAIELKATWMQRKFHKGEFRE